MTAPAPQEPALVAVPVPPPIPPPPDPVTVLIATSQDHFTAGERELGLGHLERAKSEFNQALGVLLKSPEGARSDARLREHFDRLVDRISTYEIMALSAGDGFTEKRYETASIDDLLALSTFDQPPAPPELKQAVATDLRSVEHDIPIPLNAKVLAYVQLFQGKLRSYIEEGLKRGARYLPMIQSVFRAEGLPLDLAYVPLIESAFKPDALSRAKAKGVWQFMSGTATAHGLKRDWYVDERADPEKATAAAAAYLKTLYGLFDGDWYLALASYNGGPGTLQRAIRRTGLEDFWKLSEKRRVLPRETCEYVPMILAAMVIARNPAQYGLTVLPDNPLVYETVPLPAPVDLRRIAEWAGVSVDDIQQLNPELRRWTTPLPDRDDPPYEIKVPPGTGPLVAQRLADSDPGSLATFEWYTVKRGDTLASVAKRYKVTRTDLAQANYLSTRATLKTDERLIVPRPATTMLAARTDRPAPATSSPAIAGTTSHSSVLAAAPDGRPSEQAKLIYEVKRGDTLFKIARLFRTSVEALKQWNHLRSNLINPGDRLTIFTKGLTPTS